MYNLLREDKLQPTKVFAKAGLDNVTSTKCKHQQRFGLDVQFSALVHNFNSIFSNGHLYRAGRSMNSLPSQILERWPQCVNFPKAKDDKTNFIQGNGSYAGFVDLYHSLYHIYYLCCLLNGRI
jgi:hypothetical protein